MPKLLFQLIKSFYPPFILFSFHLIMMFGFNIYRVWPDFDILMHFGGGLTMGMTAFFLVRLARENKWLSVENKLVQIFLTICFVALMAMLWEFAEFLSDVFLLTHMQAGLSDTMFDMLLGLCGGLVVGVFTLMFSQLWLNTQK